MRNVLETPCAESLRAGAPCRDDERRSGLTVSLISGRSICTTSPSTSFSTCRSDRRGCPEAPPAGRSAASPAGRGRHAFAAPSQGRGSEATAVGPRSRRAAPPRPTNAFRAGPRQTDAPTLTTPGSSSASRRSPGSSSIRWIARESQPRLTTRSTDAGSDPPAARRHAHVVRSADARAGSSSSINPLDRLGVGLDEALHRVRVRVQDTCVFTSRTVVVNLPVGPQVRLVHERVRLEPRRPRPAGSGTARAPRPSSQRPAWNPAAELRRFVDREHVGWARGRARARPAAAARRRAGPGTSPGTRSAAPARGGPARVALLRLGLFAHRQPERDVLRHGHVAEQREVLEDEATRRS